MARNSNRVPLLFHKGINVGQEESVLEEGFATDIENYISEPHGGVRVRRGWLNSATTSAPATRKGRGMGILPYQDAYNNPAQINDSDMANGAVGTCNATWTAATTANNLLVAIMSFQGGTGTTITPPAGGWLLAKREDNGTLGGVAIYYIANAASQSGAKSWLFSGAAAASVKMYEVSNIITASPLDQVAGNDETSSTAWESGTTGSTAQPIEFAIAALGGNFNKDWSLPQSGFILEEQTPSVTPSLAGFTKITVTAGPVSTGATLASSDTGAGAIATFKATAKASVTTSKLVHVAHNDTTAKKIYVHDGNDLTTGAWTLIDTISSLNSYTDFVAFSAGLGYLLYTNPHFATTRRADQFLNAGISITGAPPGRTIAFHRNAFWIGGTLANSTRLYRSALGDPYGWDTTLTTAMFMEVGQGDGTSIQDLLSISEGLLIAKDNSLWLLSGRDSATFVLDQVESIGVGAGRGLCNTPYGVVVAGPQQVFLWDGSATNISKAIEGEYAPAGEFITTAYVDEEVYICDESTGTLWVFDLRLGKWRKETIGAPTTNGPAGLASRGNTLYYYPQAGSSVSLVAYKDSPGTARGIDVETGLNLILETPELWITGPADNHTIMHLALRVRCRGAGGGEMTVTPTYDGHVQDAITFDRYHETAQPQLDYEDTGTFRVRLDVGSYPGSFNAKFRFSQGLNAGQNLTMDIDEAVLIYDVEPYR
jgi:hypothetical protein